MSERRSPSKSYAGGRAGRHKHRGSPEARWWDRGHLAPRRPSWMSEVDYRRLIELRGRL
jgi:hypothetical protein